MRQSVLLTVAALGLAVGARASVVSHESFDSNFNSFETLPSTWLQHGIEGVPSGTYADFFRNYSSSEPYRLLVYNNNQVAFTISEFADGSPCDQWLITPEFEITHDSELLYFTVYASGTTNRCNYSVLLSEGGVEPGDFDTEVIASALQGEMQTAKMSTRRVVISGQAGKKVRLAFVDKGNTYGILGFGEIGVAPYYMQIENAEGLESMIIDADNPTLTFKLKVATTNKVSGLTAVLECGNGFETQYDYTGNISSAMFTTISPVFENIDFGDVNQMPYKVRVRPNDPSLPETVIEGMLVKAPRVYTSNVVAEEGTGTWCGWCPYGMGIMDYFAHKYDGRDGRSKFIPVAVHSGDPMQPAEDYLLGVQTVAQKHMPNLGYPYMMGNRATCQHPLELDVDALAEQKAFAQLYVSRVDLDDSDYSVNVKFRPRVSFDTEDFSFRASAILVENGLSGTGSQWAQTNNLYQYTEAMMEQAVGAEKTEYLKRFLNRTTATVPASEMVYNDVSRNAYPSFEGMMIGGAWQADAFRDEEISFRLPSTVVNHENISVVVILTDNSTGQIVAADEVKYEDFGKDLDPTGSVEGIVASGDGISLYRSGDMVVAEVEEAGQAVIYGMDGRQLGVVALTAGRNEIALPAGMAVVRVTTPSCTAALKTINF